MVWPHFGATAIDMKLLCNQKVHGLYIDHSAPSLAAGCKDVSAGQCGTRKPILV